MSCHDGMSSPVGGGVDAAIHEAAGKQELCAGGNLARARKSRRISARQGPVKPLAGFAMDPWQPRMGRIAAVRRPSCAAISGSHISFPVDFYRCLSFASHQPVINKILGWESMITVTVSFADGASQQFTLEDGSQVMHLKDQLDTNATSPLHQRTNDYADPHVAYQAG